MDPVQLGQLTTFLAATSPQCLRQVPALNSSNPPGHFIEQAEIPPAYLHSEKHGTQLQQLESQKETAGISPSPYIAAEQLGTTYVASITTPTPAGCKASVMAIAICLVRRSWTERRAGRSNLLNLTSLNASSSTHHRKDGIKILHPRFQVCLSPPLPAQALVFLN